MAGNKRVWFITGVSTGLGRALAEAVLAEGETVIGTLRRSEQVEAFETLAPGRAIGCLLDVAKAPDIPKAFSQAIAKTGRVDVIVNNAGYGLLGALEETSDDELRHQMETNFFGLVGVIRAALPHLRRQRSGHIINISSVAGFRANAALVIYGASKHAVTGLSQGLAQELAPLGIHVTVVEPGGFRTEWAGASMNRVENRIADYDSVAGVFRERVTGHHGHQNGDPRRAAKAILALSQLKEPPVYLVLGPDAARYLREQLDFRRQQLDANLALSESTDFAAGE